jgi:hypothetical protein
MAATLATAAQAVKSWIEQNARPILANVADGRRRAHDAAWHQAVECGCWSMNYWKSSSGNIVTRFSTKKLSNDGWQHKCIKV